MNNIQIQGILISRIEKKNTNEPYYYGFFKLEGQEKEIPVVFKSPPNLKKGSQVELTGNWAKSNGNRPSFTCQTWTLLDGPPEITTQSLREQIQPLLTTSLDKKQEWNQRADFLFKKLDELKKIEELSKSGTPYLQAYLLLKNLDYSASHDGKLRQENFTQERYLKRIASELEITEKRISAYQNKALDTFAHNSIEITTQALAEKDQTIKELQQKLANKEVNNV